MSHIPSNFVVIETAADEDTEFVLAKKDSLYAAVFIDKATGHFATYPGDTAVTRQTRINDHLKSRAGVPFTVVTFPGSSFEYSFDVSPELLKKIQLAMFYVMGPIDKNHWIPAEVHGVDVPFFGNIDA